MTADEHARATLEAVLDAMPSGVLIAEAPSGRLLYANRQAEEIFRTTPKELHDPATYRLHPAWRLSGAPLEPEELPLVRALTHGEVSTGVELAFDSAAGTRVYFRINAAPVRSPRGDVIAAVCGFDDITREIEAARQREQGDRFRELFLAMLGHDLRSPLSAIAFGARVLLQRGALGAEDARVVARISAASERMRRMIDQILDLTRSRFSGGIPIEPRRMNLHDLVRRIVDELEAAHPGRTVRLDQRGEPHGVWDPDRLGQVVSNLVGNALEHTAPDAKVDVTVERVGPRVRLVVHNDGEPIAREILPTLFDPFRPSREARTGAPRGLGLGLYIAREVVLAHGGEIDVSSEADNGTTVTVTLPATATPTARTRAPFPP
jgi:signal transduction histidine kinase